MNSDFEKDGYLVVKNFISRDSADMLCALTLKAISDGVASPGQGVGGEHPFTWNINSFSAFDPLLTLLTPKMNEMLDLDLVPTYYYQRTYLRGGAMSHHTDRPSCQRSVTMNLGYSHQWPIYIVNRETGKHTEFQAEPGDALLYMGCSQEHYRDPFEGDWYSQLFLHWVEREGEIGSPHTGEMCKDFHWDGGGSPADYRKHFGENWKQILHQKGIMERKVSAANYPMDEHEAGRNYK